MYCIKKQRQDTIRVSNVWADIAQCWFCHVCGNVDNLWKTLPFLLYWRYWGKKAAKPVYGFIGIISNSLYYKELRHYTIQVLRYKIEKIELLDFRSFMFIINNVDNMLISVALLNGRRGLVYVWF